MASKDTGTAYLRATVWSLLPVLRWFPQDGVRVDTERRTLTPALSLSTGRGGKRRPDYLSLGVLVLATLFIFQSSARADNASTTAPSPDNRAVLIQLTGEINDYTRDQLEQRVDQVRGLGAKNVILSIDTYGGLLTDGLDISRFLKRQDDLHIIAFVQDKAISAGAMIAMACDEIVMSDSASLGDCAPIIFGPEGLEAMPPTERAKAEGPVLVDFNESAVRNHHDPLLAAAMVALNRAVYWVQNDLGDKRFVDDKQYAELIATKQWKDVPGAPIPIVGPDTLLTVDSQQAVQYGLASGIAADPQTLAHQRGLTIIADLSPGWGDDLVQILSGPVARGLLIVIFLQCLYIVLHAPGHGVAETIGLAAATGLAGCSVEDFTRRPGEPIYDLGLARERVAAAASAAGAAPGPLVLTARAENYLHGRPDLADTIRRLQAYQEAGADVLYAPGLTSLADIRAVVSSVDRPVNVLAFAGAPAVPQLAAAGVRRISVGSAFSNAALGALVSAARELRDEGTYGFLDLAATGRAQTSAAFRAQ